MGIKRQLKQVEKTFSKNRGKFLYRGPNGGYVFMRSSWEVLYAQWLDQKKISWVYEPFAFRVSSNTFYFPDFYLSKEKIWIEIKGRLLPSAAQKMKEFQALYPNEKLVMLQKADLEALGVLEKSTHHRKKI